MHYSLISASACEKACQTALDLLANELPRRMYYHSLSHTVDEVLPMALHIANRLDLNETDTQLLKTAACFHDTGFTERRSWHEQASMAIARRILPEYGYQTAHIDAVCRMILATELPQKPVDLLSQILADADLDLLGRPDYFKRNLDLRLELTAVGVHLTDAEWYATQLSFIKEQHYFTLPARDLRASVKRENIRKLEQTLDALPLPIFASPLPDLHQFGIPIPRHYEP